MTASRLRVNEITNIDGITPPLARYGMQIGNNTSLDSTTLDWYQEGTFTPVMKGTTSAGSYTYPGRSGVYTRIGRVVTLQIGISWTTPAPAGTGFMVVDLSMTPFVPSPYYGTLSVMAEFMSFTGSHITGYYRASTSVIELWGCSASNASWVQVPYQGSGDIHISGSLQLGGV